MEDTARVVRLSVPTEISESWIKLCEVIRRPEDFCPVRPWLEGLKRGFDLWYHRSDACRIRLPGEMDSETLRWYAELSQSSSAGRLLGHS
jgi:hypothetical protein